METSQLSYRALSRHFPFDSARPVQIESLRFIAEHPEGVLLEIPTGEGKTAIGITYAQTLAAHGEGPIYYVTPTKAQVEQVHRAFPETMMVMGRSEYPCLYYRDEELEVTAEESPCYMLRCPHRVDPESGQTDVPGVVPCPYQYAKYLALKRAKKGGTIVSTTAFYLLNRLFVPSWTEATPALTVLDEAHRLAKIVRSIFEYQLTDYHLRRAIELVSPIDPANAAHLKKFLDSFMRIARKRPSLSRTLLKDEEIERLVSIIEEADASKLEKNVRKAIDRGEIDPITDQSALKIIENLVRSIPRLVRSLKFSLEGTDQRPLNYVVAFYYREDDEEYTESRKKARFHLTIKAYHVAPVIRKTFENRVLAYSATIGEPSIWGFETGLKFAFKSFGTSFPTDNARIYMPSDTPNLSAKRQRRGDLTKILRRVAEQAFKLAKKQIRSLVVVISEEERRRFLETAQAMNLDTLSYGNGSSAKEIAHRFREGEGMVLVGTAAQYAEGIDLPKQTAPVIFFLRPGYQRPDDPETQFEQRRFSEGHCWALWNWRVMMEALQVRGRNIRDADDLGVCIFVSQQFRRFLYGALPEWLRPSYNGQVTLEEAVKKAIQFLK